MSYDPDDSYIGRAATAASSSFQFNAWRFFVTMAVLVLLGDHLGIWDIDGFFTGEPMTFKELAGVVAGAGMLWNSLFSKREKK